MSIDEGFRDQLASGVNDLRGLTRYLRTELSNPPGLDADIEQLTV